MQSFALVPAAGRSVRMGRPKLLLPWGRSSVIQQVVAAWQASGVTRVVVIVRPDDSPLAGTCRAAGADVVQPDTAPPEMKVSVALGLQHLQQHYRPTPADVWLLAPADMPRLAPAVVRRLLDAHRPDQPAILVPTLHGQRGHPVLFPWPLADHVHQLADDQGVNALLARHPLRTIPCQEPTILDDMDTPEDYRRLQDETG